MVKYISTICCILFLHVAGVAQPYSGSISDQDGLVSFWNPALINDNDNGISVWFSEIQSSFYNSAFSFDDIVLDSGGKNVINFQPVIENLESSNRGLIDASYHTLGVTWKKESLSLGIGHKIRYVTDMSYTEELIRLVSHGNAQYIGQQINVGPGFSYTHYHELYLSGALQLNGFSLGARIKFLAGNEYMGSDNSKINLTTLEDYYALQFSNNYTIETSGIFSYNGLNNVDLDFDPLRLQKLFGGNSGLAFDFGMTMDVGARGKLMLSYIDLGSINWDINTRKYESIGDFIYEGVDILDYVTDDGNVEIADSLYQLLQFTETEDVDFSLSIPAQWSIGFKSGVSDADILLITLYGRRHKSKNLISAMIGYNKKFNNTFSGALAYNLTGNSYTNIGATVFMNFNAFRIYVGMENVMNAVNVFGSKYGGIHLGMNLKL